MSGIMRDSSDRAMIGISMERRDSASTKVTMWPCLMDDGAVIGPIVSLLIASAVEEILSVVRRCA